MDMITVFLSALLKVSLYVEQPKEHEIKGKYHFVCLLLRILHGLRQFPREWYLTLRDFLISKRFKHTKSDDSLLVNEEPRLIFSMYVNDQLDQ